MGDIKAFNNAGINDNPNTITNVNGTTARVVDLFMTKQELSDLQAQVNQNTENFEDIYDGAPVSLNSFGELAENLDLDDFIEALYDE